MDCWFWAERGATTRCYESRCVTVWPANTAAFKFKCTLIQTMWEILFSSSCVVKVLWLCKKYSLLTPCFIHFLFELLVCFFFLLLFSFEFAVVKIFSNAEFRLISEVSQTSFFQTSYPEAENVWVKLAILFIKLPFKLWALMFLLLLCFTSSSIYALLCKKGQMLHVKECSHFEQSAEELCCYVLPSCLEQSSFQFTGKMCILLCNLWLVNA